MPYPPEMVQPMKEELTQLGIKELISEAEVVEALEDNLGTTMLVINSVCGCAAGNARPAVKMALQNPNRPDKVVTVFAGQDLEATAKARSYISGYPPSSPAIAFFRDQEVVMMLERKDIEGRTAQDVAYDLVSAFDKYCAVQPK